MTATIAPPGTGKGLYPPTVSGATGPLPLPKLLWRLVRNPLTSLPQSVYEESVVVQYSGRLVAAWVTDPGVIEKVLLHEADRFSKAPVQKRLLAHLGDGILNAEGDSWRWQRRTAAPLFRPADLASLVPAMAAAAEAQLERWTQSGADRVQAVDRDMSVTTFRVLSATMFAGSVDTEAAEILRSIDTMVSTASWTIAMALIRFPAWLWHPAKHRRQLAARQLRETAAAILARRRAEGLKGDDLLARLARAHDPETAAPMLDRQLVDNLLTFLGAGHETTARALSWTLYLLARAPEWQSRVRDEVLSVAGHGPVGVEHLDKLTTTRAVLEEAMRLYPTFPIIPRQAATTIELGDKTIPAGANVTIPVFAVHRHRRLWDDPERFDPERFLPGRRERIARTQFMPFGFGPRICIGGAFAMMEGVTILSTLVRGAEFAWDGHHLPEPVSRTSLRPKGGLPLRVRLLDAQHQG